MEQKARDFATEAHKGQFRMRRDGKTPYINHCAAVVNLLKGIGIKDENILAAAWLHDVVEDCNIDISEIEKEFSREVARIVFALTRNVEREEYKKRIKDADYAVQIVKLADMVHNCSEIHEELKFKTVIRKIEEGYGFYLEMAENICPEFYEMLSKSLEPFGERMKKIKNHAKLMI